MEIERKRIFFGISLHIDSYHSYRGDSIGRSELCGRFHGGS